MGQKVQILAAIAHDPEFVILDEPFSGLDPVNQQVMEDLIRDRSRRNRTVLFSTHVMEHAERLCDRILLIARGRLILDGSLAEAKRTVPRRVRLETEDDIGPLRGLEQVVALRPLPERGEPAPAHSPRPGPVPEGGGATGSIGGPIWGTEALAAPTPSAPAAPVTRWELELREEADPQAILQALLPPRHPALELLPIGTHPARRLHAPGGR